MNRGDLYLVKHPTDRDPKKQRAFVVVSRQALIKTRYSTVVCAPVYTKYDGLASQVPIGQEEGVKHPSSIHCDELISILKGRLTDYIGSLSPLKIVLLNRALRVALDLPDSDLFEAVFK